MQAYGSDRVRAVDGERVELSSRIPKAWTPRVPKTLTTAEFPGTAVLWEERYFEVIAAEPLPQGGVRYVLEPWREMHAMRTIDHYDDAHETERLAEYRAQRSRERKRKSANALAVLAGHLPAAVQEEIGRELGIIATRLTILSALGVYAVVIALVLWIVSGIMSGTPRPLPAYLATGYLFIETSLRFGIAWLVGRPAGSAIGVLGYLVYYVTVADRSRAVSPFAREKGTVITITETPADRAVTDSLLMREALVTLLSPADQARVAARFGYDYRHQSSLIAILILFFAAIGVATSLHRGAVISLIAASVIAAEQIYRLAILRSRPAGSILGIAARPFVRKLL
ncbi:MAG: hypothetical protein JO088_05760 [Acidobacteria bacterium]|nr:hypothetical protein [Acidobacteriota bacterium]MBV9070592.1 hypothetical protein [Acidobacteriota bacterium]